jgi:hypothetical protein
MRLRALLLCLAILGFGIMIHQQAYSEDTTKAPTQDEIMAAYMKYAQPGEFHKYLEPLVGEWAVSIKMWMNAGAPPEESKGTTVSKWILGSRFVQEDASGSMGGMPFHGMGITGYDNVKNEYVSFWIDEMATSFMITSGKSDPTGKIITMSGSYADPMANMAQTKFKTITRIIDNNQHVYEMYNTGSDGKEFKSLELTYTRQK